MRPRPVERPQSRKSRDSREYARKSRKNNLFSDSLFEKRMKRTAVRKATLVLLIASILLGASAIALSLRVPIELSRADGSSSGYVIRVWRARCNIDVWTNSPTTALRYSHTFGGKHVGYGSYAVDGMTSATIGPGASSFNRRFGEQVSPPTLLTEAVWFSLWIPVGLMLAAYLLHSVMWRKRAVPGYCARCEYCLHDNTSGRCPECGTPIPEETKKRLREAEKATGSTV